MFENRTKYRKRLRTTNTLERLNEEIRRRERAIRIFPNEMSAQRLIGAVLMEIDEAWTTGHRYCDIEEYWAWRAEQEATGEEGTSDVNHDNRTWQVYCVAVIVCCLPEQGFYTQNRT